MGLRLQLRVPDRQCQQFRDRKGPNTKGRLSEMGHGPLGTSASHSACSWSPPAVSWVPRPVQREKNREKTWPVFVARALEKGPCV